MDRKTFAEKFESYLQMYLEPPYVVSRPFPGRDTIRIENGKRDSKFGANLTYEDGQISISCRIKHDYKHEWMHLPLADPELIPKILTIIREKVPKEEDPNYNHLYESR